MKIFHNIEDFIKLFTVNDTVALSAPLFVPEDSSLIIGYFSPGPAPNKGNIHLHDAQSDSWKDLL